MTGPRDRSLEETPASDGTGPAVPRHAVSDSERTDGPNGPADRMTFLEHLDELRSRLIRAAIAIMVAFVGCFFFYDEVFNFLMQPLRNVIEPYGGSLIATAPQENFVLGIKMSFLVAIVVSTPVWLGQAWGFIAPGLYRHERHLAVPFVIVGSVFFISGAVFCHYILFPIGAEFLSTFGGVGEDIEIRYRVSETFSFYARLVLVTAVMFQIPHARAVAVPARSDHSRFPRPLLQVRDPAVFRVRRPPDPSRSGHPDPAGGTHDPALHLVHRDCLGGEPNARQGPGGRVGGIRIGGC